jgi:hypothetical protein
LRLSLRSVRREAQYLEHGTRDEQEDLLPTIDQQQTVEAEPALVRAADDVSRAKMDIRGLLRGNTDETWTIREIQDRLSLWRGTIVHLALLDMRRQGEVEMGDDLAIRVLSLNTD